MDSDCLDRSVRAVLGWKMAEDLDEKAKRVRSLLSSFYGSGEVGPDSPGGTNIYSLNGVPVSPARRDTLITINTKDFDLQRYMASLVISPLRYYAYLGYVSGVVILAQATREVVGGLWLHLP